MNRYCLAVLLITTCFTAVGQTENVRAQHFNIKKTVALEGIDPVSYFKGKAAKGTEKFAHTFKGLTYYFVNNENLEEFKKSPSKYEPAYGGWCAYHMSVDGQRVRVDPSTFKIINGKVYLYSTFTRKNYLRAWEQNEKKYKESADKLWIKKMH